MTAANGKYVTVQNNNRRRPLILLQQHPNMMISKPLDTILIAVAVSAAVLVIDTTNAFATNEKKLVHDHVMRNSHRCSKFTCTMLLYLMLLFGHYAVCLVFRMLSVLV